MIYLWFLSEYFKQFAMPEYNTTRQTIAPSLYHNGLLQLKLNNYKILRSLGNSSVYHIALSRTWYIDIGMDYLLNPLYQKKMKRIKQNSNISLICWWSCWSFQLGLLNEPWGSSFQGHKLDLVVWVYTLSLMFSEMDIANTGIASRRANRTDNIQCVC